MDMQSFRKAELPGTKLCARLSLDDFLCFEVLTDVAPTPDDSRSTFFYHLGLQETCYRHRMLYSKMKSEARAGMRRLFDSPYSLALDVVQDKTIAPPYSVNQMSEVAFQQEVENIYARASRQTRGIYDLVRTENGHNWVIRWMLWHVIHGRQAQSSRATSSAGETDCSTASSDSARTDWSPSIRRSPDWGTATASPHDCSDSDAWDDEYRAQELFHAQEDYRAQARLQKESPADSKSPNTPRRSIFWDHVMT